MPKSPRNSQQMYSLHIITLLFVVFLIFYDFKVVNSQDIEKNHQRVVEALLKIAQAQEEYKKISPQKEYTPFHIHLWQDVSVEGEAIQLDLIPHDLAFAMERALSLNGYYYTSIIAEESVDGGNRGNEEYVKYYDRKDITPFDFKEEWAIGAVPRDVGKTGEYNFIMKENGIIYYKKMKGQEIDLWPKNLDTWKVWSIKK